MSYNVIHYILHKKIHNTYITNHITTLVLHYTIHYTITHYYTNYTRYTKYTISIALPSTLPALTIPPPPYQFLPSYHPSPSTLPALTIPPPPPYQLLPSPPPPPYQLLPSLPLHLTTSYHPSPQGCGSGSAFICPSGSGSRGLKNSTKM